EWWAGGLISSPDRVADPFKPQFQMVLDCVQEIMADAPTTPSFAIANDPCVSLARFYPALFSLAGRGPYRFDPGPGGVGFERRSNLVFTRLLQQWLQLAGFIARNGTAQRSAADVVAQLTSDDNQRGGL